jgi:glucose-6-phosphate 1-epimerase
MCDADTLNAHFGIPGVVDFGVGGHGALEARLAAAGASATVARQGAQVLSWAPAGQPPVVWLSPAARFAPGKSLRGGVPVCWPWFGPHPDDTSKPSHGFARNLDWRVLETSRLRHGARILMGMVPGAEQAALWPHDAELRLAVTLGTTLELELTTRNTGVESITITQALHSYFHVGDIASVQVEGLDGCPYIDRLAAGARFTQRGPVTIEGEVDRIYLDCPGDVEILDRTLERRVLIAKSGSRSCVVWNPWIDKGAKLGDLGEEGHHHMLCVETTNAWDDSMTLAPGASHTLGTSIGVADL